MCVQYVFWVSCFSRLQNLSYSLNSFAQNEFAISIAKHAETGPSLSVRCRTHNSIKRLTEIAAEKHEHEEFRIRHATMLMLMSSFLVF